MPKAYHSLIIINLITVGNYQKAEKLFSKLLSRLRKEIGESNLYTLDTMSNLAGAYDSQGKHSDAEVLYKQCLDKYKVVAGENHAFTLSIMNNLAGNYVSQGNYD